MERNLPPDDTRIYVQMKPDEAAVDALTAIGRDLPAQDSGRLLPPEELHITLIHFGKAREVLAALRGAANVGDETFAAQLEAYVADTAALLTGDTYTLKPQGYARFGVRHATLVGRYEAPSELAGIHARAYDRLVRFIGGCGIANAEDFARGDPNFRYAGRFTPHATIYKGYEGPDPEAPLPPMDVRFAGLVYYSRLE